MYDFPRNCVGNVVQIIDLFTGQKVFGTSTYRIPKQYKLA